MKSILSRFAGPSPSPKGTASVPKEKAPAPKDRGWNEKEKPPGFAWGLGNQNGMSEEAASAGPGADVSSSFGFALPLTEKSVTTMETFS